MLSPLWRLRFPELLYRRRYCLLTNFRKMNRTLQPISVSPIVAASTAFIIFTVLFFMSFPPIFNKSILNSISVISSEKNTLRDHQHHIGRDAQQTGCRDIRPGCGILSQNNIFTDLPAHADNIFREILADNSCNNTRRNRYFKGGKNIGHGIGKLELHKHRPLFRPRMCPSDPWRKV